MSCTDCTIKNKTKLSSHGILYADGCSVISHNKRSVFNWLSSIELPSGVEQYDILEVAFKNGRKAFYRNMKALTLYTGDIVVVEGNPGYDVGVISITGELVKLQMKRKKIKEDSDQIKNILRKAHQKDINIWQKARQREPDTQREARIIIEKLGLTMKLSDVEFQGDGKKATFYYTADARVDFRQLIRDLASAFHIRVEMKQVDYRHEASRLGGIGSCGRELCCSTWMSDFRKVNNQAARYQQLSLNPQKLQGQCGRLKCCLNFELETYLDALKEFPDTDIILKTEKGDAKFIKMDIFKGYMWYAYDNNEDYKWYQLEVDQVKEIIEKNKQGNKVASLSDWEVMEYESKPLFENPVGEDSLTRFDKPKKKRKKRKRKNKKPGNQKQNNRNNQKNK